MSLELRGLSVQADSTILTAIRLHLPSSFLPTVPLSSSSGVEARIGSSVTQVALPLLESLLGMWKRRRQGERAQTGKFAGKPGRWAKNTATVSGRRNRCEQLGGASCFAALEAACELVFITYPALFLPCEALVSVLQVVQLQATASRALQLTAKIRMRSPQPPEGRQLAKDTVQTAMRVLQALRHPCRVLSRVLPARREAAMRALVRRLV